MKAKIHYFTLQDEQTKEEKLEWFEQSRFEQIPFEHVTPDRKHNWVNLTNNDFDDFLPLIDKQVKAGKSQKAIFQLFSAGIKTQRDDWVYNFSRENLIERMKYFVEIYQERLRTGIRQKLDIKWDESLEKYLSRQINKKFEVSKIILSLYRPFINSFLYLDPHFNARTYQLLDLFNLDLNDQDQLLITFSVGRRGEFSILLTELVPNLDIYIPDTTQCLPLYRYDEKGDRIDNITDWGLTQFQTHYNDPSITKLDIFHYTYAVLHHPAYRTKYELNLKREFPRLAFYANFHQWTPWGKALMELHLTYETAEPYGLEVIETSSKG